MRKWESFYDSKKGKIITWLTFLAIIIFAIVIMMGIKYWQEMHYKEISQPVEIVETPIENIEEDIPVLKKVPDEYVKKDPETNKIWFDYNEINVTKFVLTDSEEGPTDDDVWIETPDEGWDMEIPNGEIVKKYVYYLASDHFQCDSPNKKYETLAKAVAGANSGATLTLLGTNDNTTDKSDVTISKKISLVTNNGNTLNKSTTPIRVNSGGDFHFYGGGSYNERGDLHIPHDNTKNECVVLVQGGTFNVHSGYVNAQGYPDRKLVWYIRDKWYCQYIWWNSTSNKL